MSRHRFLDRIDEAVLAAPYGEVRRVAPGRLEASGPAATVGELCRIGTARMLAEVAAVSEDGLVLVPIEDSEPARVGERVEPVEGGGTVGVGHGFAGRAIDALGRAIDDQGAIRACAHVPLRGAPTGALDRVGPAEIFATGIRAIDGLLTLGRGQRIGVFAASGVGKTSLIDQIVDHAPATRQVLCLVGERGREVEGLWRTVSARADADRFSLIAATSDASAAMRARSVSVALCLAEYWRDRGEHVLLVIDSVTRLAMALREIGLAGGEPPTVRAYTPNVFAALPRMVERCGGVRGGGAITAVMTVLSETDDVDDPIAETMKSLLDGHIVLSRALADRGHFPAIDVTRSVSRLATRLMTKDHAAAARSAVALLGTFDQARVMIESGLYQAGSAPEIDAAIAGRDALMAFLRQGQDEHAALAETVATLAALRQRAVHDA